MNQGSCSTSKESDTYTSSSRMEYSLERVLSVMATISEEATTLLEIRQSKRHISLLAYFANHVAVAIVESK